MGTSIETTSEQQTHASTRDALLGLLSQRSGSERVDWVRAQLSTISTTRSTEPSVQASKVSDLASTLSARLGEPMLEMSRHFGKRHLVGSFSERDHAHLTTPLGPMPIGHWKCDEAAKVWLLSEVISAHVHRDDRFKVLYVVYDGCDTEGRVACLRAINLIDGEPRDAMEIIHDGGRTYLNELMEAGWCNSPFAARWLSDEEYRKAVLKSLFCNVSVDGFLHLDQRADPELSRSLCEYANEREAAGRPVPMAVWRVAAFYPVPGLIARLIGRLEHPSSEERLTAAIGLGRAEDLRSESFIADRLTREDVPAVITALQEALNQLRDTQG